MGRIVKEKKYIYDKKYILDLNGFEKGIYWAKIIIDGQTITKKIILQ